MLRTLRTICVALGLATALANVAASETVKVGVAAEPYPPMTFQTPSGQWGGWEIEFSKLLCAEAKLDCVITPVAWDGIIPALQSRKIDIIVSSMSITEKRKQVIDFSDRYYHTPTAVVGPKAGKFDASPDGAQGKTIGVLSASIQEDYVHKHFPGAANVKSYQSQDDAFQDLAAGRIDAVVADAITADAFIKTVGGGCCDIKGTVADDPAVLGIGVGVGLRQNEPELRQRLNAAILAVRASGAFQQLAKRYFAFEL